MGGAGGSRRVLSPRGALRLGGPGVHAHHGAGAGHRGPVPHQSVRHVLRRDHGVEPRQDRHSRRQDRRLAVSGEPGRLCDSQCHPRRTARRQVRAPHPHPERCGRLDPEGGTAPHLAACDLRAREPGLPRLRRPGVARRRETASRRGPRRQDLADPAQPRAADGGRDGRRSVRRDVLPGSVLRDPGACAIGRRGTDSGSQGDHRDRVRPGHGGGPTPWQQGNAGVARTAPAPRSHRSVVPDLRPLRYAEGKMEPSPRRSALMLTAAVLILGSTQGVAAQPAPAGEAVIGWHVTLAPSWFDPSTAPPQITPFGLLYAIHDALLRPLPGQKMGASLAESWKESPDGRVYEFKLRGGLKFHNGDPVTAEDVKFSFERYKGAGSKALQARVQQVEIVDPLTVRFHLKEPWPDFLTFYGTSATAAGIVVPKKYLTQVGDDGFRKHPVGAGPYTFVSHKPGIEVVLEAYPGYWRHAPYVKRLIMKSVPEGTTRVAMLKNSEADIALALDGEDALNVKRDPRLQLVPSRHASIYWIEFADQWDPKSPWHDKRLRLAVNYALDRQAISEAACLGLCPPAGVIVPRVMDFALQVAPPPYDPQKAKQLLAEGGYPDIDDLFLQQARELDPRKREALLHKIQQLTIDRAIFAPIMDLRALNGVGPRVADHTINALHMVPWPSWEDMRLQGQ